MKLFSLDLETTGLDKDNCQVLEFGCIYLDTDNPLSYEDSPKFHRILKFDEPIVGQPFAIQLNNRLFRIISGVDEVPDGCDIIYYSTYAQCMKELIYQFRDWAQDTANEKNNFRVTLLGKNVAAFDLQFSSPHVPEGLSCGKLFRHRCMDIGPLIALPSDNEVPGLEKCLERSGLDGPTNLHSALGDAWDVIRILSSKWQLNIPS